MATSSQEVFRFEFRILSCIPAPSILCRFRTFAFFPRLSHSFEFGRLCLAVLFCQYIPPFLCRSFLLFCSSIKFLFFRCSVALALSFFAFCLGSRFPSLFHCLSLSFWFVLHCFHYHFCLDLRYHCLLCRISYYWLCPFFLLLSWLACLSLQSIVSGCVCYFFFLLSIWITYTLFALCTIQAGIAG